MTIGKSNKKSKKRSSNPLEFDYSSFEKEAIAKLMQGQNLIGGEGKTLEISYDGRQLYLFIIRLSNQIV